LYKYGAISRLPREEGRRQIMKRSFTILVLATSMALLAAGFGFCQESGKQPQTKESAPSAKPAGKQVVGDVVKVDTKAKSVTVKIQGGQKKFDIANAELAGYQSIGDIKAGDKIAILYEEKNGAMVARAVANHSAMMKMHAPTK
jgi:hypothetical protein